MRNLFLFLNNNKINTFHYILHLLLYFIVTIKLTKFYPHMVTFTYKLFFFFFGSFKSSMRPRLGLNKVLLVQAPLIIFNTFISILWLNKGRR